MVNSTKKCNIHMKELALIIRDCMTSRLSNLPGIPQKDHSDINIFS